MQTDIFTKDNWINPPFERQLSDDGPIKRLQIPLRSSTLFLQTSWPQPFYVYSIIDPARQIIARENILASIRALELSPVRKTLP